MASASPPPLGYYHTTVSGTLLNNELNAAPDRSKLKLGISYAMSAIMRQFLTDAELDVEIDKAKVGPQLFAVVSAQDAQHPDAATRGESMPVAAGETCVIKGRNLKVGGPAEANAGITLTRQDKSGVTPIFIPAARLFPNTPHTGGLRDARRGRGRLCMASKALHAAECQEQSTTEGTPYGSDG